MASQFNNKTYPSSSSVSSLELVAHDFCRSAQNHSVKKSSEEFPEGWKSVSELPEGWNPVALLSLSKVGKRLEN